MWLNYTELGSEIFSWNSSSTTCIVRCKTKLLSMNEKEIVQVHIYATDQSSKNLEVELSKHLRLDKVVVVTKTDFMAGRGYIS